MAEKDDLPGSTSSTTGQENQQLIFSFIAEIVKSPVNVVLVGVIALLVYKIVKSKTHTEEPVQEVKKLPKLRRDFTLQELRKYDGTGPDGRILVAVNGSVYDCTRGAHFYGPNAPYAAFGGRDASRGLAVFAVNVAEGEYDDLSDLDTTHMSFLREWEEQFKERYDYVGKLLKPGEVPTNYSDEEDEGSQQESETKSDHQEPKDKLDHQESDTKSKSD